MSLEYNMQKLRDITREVDEFHPLLRKLLPKLDNVLEVDYTHGNNEMGADFVVSWKQQTFNEIDYIGIIAKVGKIQQDLATLNRQIEECDVPRPFKDGRKTININEIWVVTTGNITNGAKRKIYEKFKNRKIRFIGDIALEKLIDEHLPSYWSDIPIEVGEYLHTLGRTNATEDSTFSLVTLADEENIYIEPDIYEYHPPELNRVKSRKSRHQKRVDILKALEENKVSLLEGGMGAGKSKLIRNLVEQLTNPSTFSVTKILPLKISFRQLYDKYDNSVDEFINDEVSLELRNVLEKDTKFLVLIDGLDERNLDTEQHPQLFEYLIKQSSERDDITILITSRYLRSFEVTTLGDAPIKRYELRPLSLSKTIEFVNQLCKSLDSKSRILEDLKNSSIFNELPKSPIAAILLAKLINEQSDELPATLTELYAKYTELTLGRWDVQKDLQSDKEYQALNNIIMRLSEKYIENEQIELPIEEVKLVFDDYLEERNLDINSDELFQQMLERSDILVKDSRNKSILFKHRTFAEYFYAQQKFSAETEQLQMDHQAFELYWVNIYFFYFGLRKDCPKLLESLSQLLPAKESQRWVKLLNMPSYFLAAYTSPYRCVVEGMEVQAVEAAKLYVDSASNDSDTLFARLPRMKLLWLTRFIFTNGYAYKYFEAAVQEAIVNITSGKYSDEEKAYAIFFLASVCVELEDPVGYDLLLDAQKELPLDISASLYGRFQDVSSASTMLKKHNKRFRKNHKQSKQMQHLVKTFYDIPINKLSNKQ